MPRLFTPSLLNIHDIVVVAAIAIMTHYFVLPVYDKIANKA